MIRDFSLFHKPIQLGSPKSSHHVLLLHTLPHKRGIVPKFDIEGNQFGFGGRLQIGDEIISRDERWSTKKEAREELAERGVEVVKSMQERAKEPAVGPGTSWVGLLLGMLTRLSGSSFHIKNLQRNLDRYVLLIILPTEFHTSIADGGGPSYTEYAVGTGFACTCTIPLSPDAFGSTSESFPTKKAARANAAREAMKHLIDQGHTNSDPACSCHHHHSTCWTEVCTRPYSSLYLCTATQAAGIGFLYASPIITASFILTVGATSSGCWKRNQWKNTNLEGLRRRRVLVHHSNNHSLRRNYAERPAELS